MAVEVSFNDKPFLWPTADVITHVERYFDDLPGEQVWPQPGYYAGGLVGSNIPLPPKPPKGRINRFYYPTGLARWACFWGVMDGKTVSELTTAVYSSGSVEKTFKISVDGKVIETAMTMLPPLKLGFSKEPEKSLYLVCLVDSRYQRRGERTINEQPSITPPSWITTESVPSAYTGRRLGGVADSVVLVGHPTVNFSARNATLSEQAAQDHIAACVGMVCVRKLDGTYKRIRWKTANTNAVSAKLGTTDFIDLPESGTVTHSFTPGDSAPARRAVLPKKVNIGYPIGILQTQLLASPKVLPISSTPSGMPARYWRTYTPPFSDIPALECNPTYEADVTVREVAVFESPWPTTAPSGETGDPGAVWLAGLETLGTQVAADYYHAMIGACDLVYNDVVVFDPEWACDLVIDFAGSDSNQCTTRISRKPFNATSAVDLLIGTDWEADYSELVEGAVHVTGSDANGWIVRAVNAGAYTEASPVVEYDRVKEAQGRTPVVDTSPTVTHILPLYRTKDGQRYFQIDQYASELLPGHVSTTDQKYKGNKQFENGVYVRQNRNPSASPTLYVHPFHVMAKQGVEPEFVFRTSDGTTTQYPFSGIMVGSDNVGDWSGGFRSGIDGDLSIYEYMSLYALRSYTDPNDGRPRDVTVVSNPGTVSTGYSNYFDDRGLADYELADPGDGFMYPAITELRANGGTLGNAWGGPYIAGAIEVDKTTGEPVGNPLSQPGFLIGGRDFPGNTNGVVYAVMQSGVIYRGLATAGRWFKDADGYIHHVEIRGGTTHIWDVYTSGGALYGGGSGEIITTTLPLITASSFGEDDFSMRKTTTFE